LVSFWLKENQSKIAMSQHKIRLVFEQILEV
jgi:hypothetical protein